MSEALAQPMQEFLATLDRLLAEPFRNISHQLQRRVVLAEEPTSIFERLRRWEARACFALEQYGLNEESVRMRGTAKEASSYNGAYVDTLIEEIETKFTLLNALREDVAQHPEFWNPKLVKPKDNVEKREQGFRTAFARYKVVKQRGEGGNSRVFEVQEEGTNNRFAIKCLSHEKVTTEKLKRFKNELFFSLKNTHKNIVTVLDYGNYQTTSGEVPFYVMPLYPKTLRNWMKEGQAQENAELIIAQLLDGVEAAHLKGIWHRDLKPENILIDEATKTIIVADWGIAHFTEAELHTTVETLPHARLANNLYAAPEQRQPGARVDARADIYALGLIINEIFTGEVIQGQGFKRIAASALHFAYFDQIIENMVQQSPEARPSSIDEIKKRLIGLRTDFISRQKLDSLRQRVIPTTELSDPLLNDPPRLIGFDYQNGNIYLTLSCPVTSEWIQAFQTNNYYGAIRGKEPNKFQFQKNVASIDISEAQAQNLVNHFKSYLKLGNDNYKQIQEKNQYIREEEERRNLRHRIEEEERRQRLLKTIKI